MHSMKTHPKTKAKGESAIFVNSRQNYRHQIQIMPTDKAIFISTYDIGEIGG